MEGGGGVDVEPRVAVGLGLVDEGLDQGVGVGVGFGFDEELWLGLEPVLAVGFKGGFR